MAGDEATPGERNSPPLVVAGPEVQPRLLSARTRTVSSSFPFPLVLPSSHLPVSLQPSPQPRNSPLSCCGRSARVSHVARGWIYKGALRRRRPYWCSRYSRARSRTTSTSSVHVDRWRILSRVYVRKLRVARTCVCVCGFSSAGLQKTTDYTDRWRREQWGD